MSVEIQEENLKNGILSLAIALVEIIRDALELQALRRMDGGSLTADETEKLGRAFMELNGAIENIKAENGIAQSVKQLRDDLDKIADDIVNQLSGGCRCLN